MNFTEIKEEGDKNYKAGLFDEACNSYTIAIGLGETDKLKTLFSNRSASFLQLKKAESALAGKC